MQHLFLCIIIFFFLEWLNPEKYDHDTTGLTKYLQACQDHDVTPVRFFIKHMLSDEMNLGHHGIGPAEMKALAVPLEVIFHYSTLYLI